MNGWAFKRLSSNSVRGVHIQLSGSHKFVIGKIFTNENVNASIENKSHGHTISGPMRLIQAVSISVTNDRKPVLELYTDKLLKM